VKTDPRNDPFSRMPSFLPPEGGRNQIGMVAAIKSVAWPLSNRNRWPRCIGIRKGIAEELRNALSKMKHQERKLERITKRNAYLEGELKRGSTTPSPCRKSSRSNSSWRNGASRSLRLPSCRASEGRLVESEGSPMALIRCFDRLHGSGADVPSAATMLGVDVAKSGEHSFSEIIDAMRMHGAAPQR
jgi:hypothetical protein